MTGMFITLEGIEGTGKSTHTEFIGELLSSHGRTVRFTREPGGTRTGERIRELLLHSEAKSITPLSELMLIFSARAQHLDEVIRPALRSGHTVVCDRFTDATYAYQGGGRGMPWRMIQTLEELVQDGLRPDLTLLFDTDVETGLARAGRRSTADRFESETLDFFQRVRNSYLEIAATESGRVRVVDATPELQQVRQHLREILQDSGLC